MLDEPLVAQDMAKEPRSSKASVRAPWSELVWLAWASKARRFASA
jgi:hypothetical protein